MNVHAIVWMICTLKTGSISMYNNFAALSTFIHLWIDTILCGLFDQSDKIESIK